MFKKYFFILSLLCLFILDRLTKLICLKVLPVDGFFFLPNFGFKLYFNPNLALSISATNSFAIILSLIAILLLVFFGYQYTKKQPVGQFALLLMLIGAYSNLLDRLRFGWIIDWLDFSWFPAFNLADVYIFIGALLLLKNIFKKRL
jgi:signal peptidase II